MIAASWRTTTHAEIEPGIGMSAGAGVTEDFAKEKGMKVRVGKFPFRANGRAVANEDVEGVVKFVADAETDRILGAGVIETSQLIALPALLTFLEHMRQGAALKSFIQDHRDTLAQLR